MNALFTDLRHAARGFRRTPGFTIIALVTLALGIGANTAIFSIVKSVLIRPLPYGGADRVVMVWGASDKGGTTWLSASEVKGYAEGSKAFDEVAGYTGGAANLTGGQEPERVVTAAVTPNLFRVLGVNAVQGRTFFLEDASAATPTAVIISYALLQRRFAGKTNVVGQSVLVNGSARTIVGVLPPDFRLPDEFSADHVTELWTPLSLDGPDLSGWGNRSFHGVARLRAAVRPAVASAEMHAAEERWVAAGFVQSSEKLRRNAVLVGDFVLGDIRGPMLVLVGAVGFILLIACANVANLMLARADERQREIAVRRALGASRGRIVRQLLAESVLLAVVGGLLGTALAFAGTRALMALHPAGVPRVGDVHVDLGVFAFTVVLAIATGVLFGLAPAIELSRPDLQRSIRDGGRTGTVGRGQQRFRDSLAVAQMAFCVILLIAATLLVRSFANLQRVDLGFDTRSALTFRLTLPQTRYPDSRRVIAFYQRALHEIEQLPGVRSVGATRLLPLTGTIGDWSISLEGHVAAPSENPNGDWQVVTPGYFGAMGLHLVSGRFLAATDDEAAPLVAVINETMATRYWPTGNVVGKRFRLGGGDPENKSPWVTIVGIARQVHHNAVTEAARAEMYIGHAQWAAAGASTPRGMTVVVRTAGDPMALVGHVRQTIRGLDANLPMADVRALQTVADNALSEPRFATTLIAVFGTLALLLATIGIYGVISLRVARRGREIGIRMALGARARTVLAMVLQRGLVIALIGVAIGTLGALWATQTLGGLLYGVAAVDPATFAAVPAVLATVALIASLVPAIRATRIDPAIVLREG
jgi:putative ABC transport system permease protein